MMIDDTQLDHHDGFISFSSPNFATNILALLKDTNSNVSALMSFHTLSLHHSKTEFLLTGLTKQVLKMSCSVIQVSPDVSISSVSAACNLGVICDANLSMITFLMSPNHVFFIFVISVSWPT